jgi:hypothetical protein
MTGQYLDSKEVAVIIGSITIDPTFELMSTDTYNERAVLKAIAATGMQDQIFYAAANLSIIGYGQKKFGSFKLKGHLVDIAELLIPHVKLNLGKDAKLAEADLTPHRICRALRYSIRAYIESTTVRPYIWKKYSDQDYKFRSIMFRGAEYLDDLTKEQAAALLDAYKRMDAKLGINISERIERIFAAKSPQNVI